MARAFSLGYSFPQTDKAHMGPEELDSRRAPYVTTSRQPSSTKTTNLVRRRAPSITHRKLPRVPGRPRSQEIAVSCPHAQSNPLEHAHVKESPKVLGPALETVDPLLPQPQKELSWTDVQVEVYQRQCAKLNVIPIGSYIRNAASRVLKLRYRGIGPRDALALCVPLTLGCHVTHLDLEGNALGSEGVRYLEGCLRDSFALIQLNLNDNGLDGEAAEAIARVVTNSILMSLSLADNKFKDADGLHFAQIVMGDHLNELDLSNNQLGDTAACHIAKALEQNGGLAKLDLRWNHIRSQGGVALLRALKKNTNLTHLWLSGNGVGDAGCRTIGRSLAFNTSLLLLDLAHTSISNQGFQLLATAICRTGTGGLQVLKLGNNLVTNDGACALGEAVLASKVNTIQQLDLENICMDEWQVYQFSQAGRIQLLSGTTIQCTVPRSLHERTASRDIESRGERRRRTHDAGKAVGATEAMGLHSAGQNATHVGVVCNIVVEVVVFTG